MTQWSWQSIKILNIQVLTKQENQEHTGLDKARKSRTHWSWQCNHILNTLVLTKQENQEHTGLDKAIIPWTCWSWQCNKMLNTLVLTIHYECSTYWSWQNGHDKCTAHLTWQTDSCKRNYKCQYESRIIGVEVQRTEKCLVNFSLNYSNGFLVFMRLI